MATTLTPTKATPFSLTLTMTGDGAPGTYNAAALDAFFGTVRGPLRTLIARLAAVNVLSHLNLNATGSHSAGKVRIRHVEGINAVQTPPLTRTIVWGAGGLDVTATNQSVSQIEIRLAHSHER